MTYSPGNWYDIDLAVDVKGGDYTVSIGGRTLLKAAQFAETVLSVERLSFRTGPHRTVPTRRMNPEPGPPDIPDADEPSELAVFHVDDVNSLTLHGIGFFKDIHDNEGGHLAGSL